MKIFESRLEAGWLWKGAGGRGSERPFREAQLFSGVRQIGPLVPTKKKNHVIYLKLQ